jgi:hypothetical protein
MRRTILVHGGLLLLLATGCGGAAEDRAGALTTNDPPATSSPPASSSISDTSGASDPNTTPPPTTVACTVGDLEMSLGESEGAAGTTYRALVFTNTGDDSCVIEGIPDVSFVAGKDRHQVGAAAAPIGTVGPPVTLERGAAATAPVGFVNIGNFAPEACQPTDVRGLRVSPPGGEADEFVAFDTTACRADDFRTMTVRTVHPGTDLVQAHA